jgi:hypothetical protein
MEELEIFTGLGAKAGKFGWVHAQNERITHSTRFAAIADWVKPRTIVKH